MPTKKYLHNIDLDQNQLVSPVLHNLSAAPTGAVDGQLYYNTTAKKVYYYNATTSTWTEVGSNIYNIDGTLTGNRTVTLGGNTITFSGATSSVGVIFQSRLNVGGGVFLYDFLSFNGSTSANKTIYANSLIFTTNNVGGYGSNQSVFTFTSATPEANSGSFTTTLVNLLMPVNTGTQGANSRALLIDFSVTTNAGALTAIQTVQGNNLFNTTSGSTYIGYSAVPSGSYKFDVSGSARVTGSKYVGAVGFSVGDTTYPFSGTYANQSGVFQVLDAGSGNTQIVLRPSSASVGAFDGNYWSYIQQGSYELFITSGGYQTFSLGNGLSKKLKLYTANGSYNTLINTVHVTDTTYLAVGNITNPTPTLTLVSSTSTTGGTGVLVEGIYYYRVVFYDWAGQIATQSNEQAVTFGTGVTTGKVTITIGNGNAGNGIFGWRIFRRYLAPGQDPVANANNPYTDAFAMSSNNTSIVDLGSGGGAWTTGTYSQQVLATNVSSYAGIRADGHIFGRQVNTGTINFFDQGQIGVTNDGVTYATQHNTTNSAMQYKSLGFMGDLRFGSFSSVQSVYYFGAKYGGTVSSSGTYQIGNLFTLTTTYDKIGVILSTQNNIVTNILNITPTYAYTDGTGHILRGIYYKPTVNSLTGVVNHYAFHAGSGDVYIEGGSVGIGTVPSATNKLEVNGAVKFNKPLTIADSTFSFTPIIIKNGSTDGSIYIGGSSMVGSDAVRNVIINPINSYSITGTSNTIVGRSASGALTSGTNNHYFGLGGNGISTGSANVMIGNVGYLFTGAQSGILVINSSGENSTQGTNYNYPSTNHWTFIGGYSSGNANNQFYFGAAPFINHGYPVSTSAITFFAPSGIGTDIFGGNFTIAAGRGTGTANGGDLIFQTSSITSSGTNLQTLSERLIIKYNTGNVAIGYASGSVPNVNKLEVNGAISTTILRPGTILFNNAANGKIVIDGGVNGETTSAGGTSTAPQSIFIGPYAGSSVSGTANNSMVCIGVSAGSSITTGGLGSILIGRNTGRGITTGVNNIIIGGTDAINLTSNLSYSLHLMPTGYEGNDAAKTLGSATASPHAFIGGGFNSASYMNYFYFGAGAFVTTPASANLNFYAPSGTGTDLVGASFTINAGRGTGTGTPGDVIFATSTATTTGTTTQTLTSRWWIKGGSGTLSNVASPSASAALQIDSTTQGFLPPRMTTTSRNAISSPAVGLSIYNTTTNKIETWDGTVWNAHW